jgi:phage-related minor tail protein
MTTDNYFNASQAAKHTGVNVVTIRDYLAKGKLPNSKQVPKGKVKVWQIPLTDLAAAGLLDKVSYATEEQTREAESLALKVENSALKTEVRLLTDMVARGDAAIEEYRQDKARLNLMLETRETQEQRRSWWFGRNK